MAAGRPKLRTIQEKWPELMKRVSIQDNGCWIYTGHVNSSGYGTVSCENMIDLPDNNSQVSVHKISYLFHRARLPKDTIILHSCDNRRCCNPDHLRAGTRLENSLDAVTRGRLKGIDYLKIFGLTRSQLAEQLNISPGNLSNRMRNWGNPYYNKNKELKS